jgi:hypothetical protein
MQWRDLPVRFGDCKNVHQRFSRWAKSGVWEVFQHSAADADNEYATTLLCAISTALAPVPNLMAETLVRLVGDAQVLLSFAFIRSLRDLRLRRILPRSDGAADEAGWTAPALAGAFEARSNGYPRSAHQQHGDCTDHHSDHGGPCARDRRIATTGADERYGSLGSCVPYPVAAPVNLMVMGPGGYRSGNYWKLGLSLLLLFLYSEILVPLVWRF